MNSESDRGFRCFVMFRGLREDGLVKEVGRWGKFSRDGGGRFREEGLRGRVGWVRVLVGN